MSIVYMIIHRTGSFGLAIHKWDCITTFQKTWVVFKHFYLTTHRELQKSLNLTVEDASMHHTNMVRNVVAGIQEVLKQEQSQTENRMVIAEPVDHVANVVQSTQQQLATQFQEIQVMMQTTQVQYSTSTQHTH